jgi:mannose-1-phosphate guanylyltransferase/mannose-6-phosphate isomerase
MNKYVIILAGGAGTRLWPASSGDRPKQFLDFNTGSSLYQRTLKRALRLKDFNLAVVVTHRDQVNEIIRQSGPIMKRHAARKELHILPEPLAKNTAPAITYACAYLRSLDPGDGLLLVLPADHLIEPDKDFQMDVIKALALAREGYLVTFGVPPDHPETGYGYIKRGAPLERGFEALEFTEKPGQAKARAFLAGGGYYWNSGMFAFSRELFLREQARLAPGMGKPFLQAAYRPDPQNRGAIRVVPADARLKTAYRKLPAISVDTAIMEKSRTRAMIEASFRWSDVGSWDQVALHFPREQKNLIQTRSKNNYVLSDLPVVLVDVENLHVIIKNDAVLVCKKGSSQMVKKSIEGLKKSV